MTGRDERYSDMQDQVEVKVRPLGLHEIVLVYGLGREFCEESPFLGASTFNPAALFSYWNAIYNAGIGQLFVAEDPDGRPVGVLGGTVSRDHVNGEIMASEIFWYVTESARRGGTGRGLIAAYEDWATARGATVITLAHTTHLMADQLSALYGKLGYTPHDVVYFKRPPQAPPEANPGEEVSE